MAPAEVMKYTCAVHVVPVGRRGRVADVLAQVSWRVRCHAAVLRGSNKEVVIKVLKPGVEDILTTDLSFLYLASRVLEFLNPELERTSMAAIVGDIRASMLDEVRGPLPDGLASARQGTRFSWHHGPE